MLIEQVKATLAMENLHLSVTEEQLLIEYAKGRADLTTVMNFFQREQRGTQKAA